jgi:hypothetical protein
MSIKHRWKYTERKAETLTGKSLKVSFCPPKFPLGLVWERNRANSLQYVTTNDRATNLRPITMKKE